MHAAQGAPPTDVAATSTAATVEVDKSPVITAGGADQVIYVASDDYVLLRADLRDTAQLQAHLQLAGIDYRYCVLMQFLLIFS